jgi:hypothetical protein
MGMPVGGALEHPIPSGTVTNSAQILGYSLDPATGVLTTLSTSPYLAGNGPFDLTFVGTID